MGKYMRKCRGAMGEEVAAMEVTQVVGVRTRSRSASAAASAGAIAKVQASKRTRKAPAPRADAAGAAGQGALLAAGLSRCSSTASSVDAAAQDRSFACCSDATEAGGERIPEGSASNSESGRGRERRETTPSSRLPGEVSDLESDLAGQKRGRSLPAGTTAAQEPTRARMPPASEIEEFFAAAEEAKAKRFAAKYNFDVVRGVPLDAGRFEWTRWSAAEGESVQRGKQLS